MKGLKESKFSVPQQLLLNISSTKALKCKADWNENIKLHMLLYEASYYMHNELGRYLLSYVYIIYYVHCWLIVWHQQTVTVWWWIALCLVKYCTWKLHVTATHWNVNRKIQSAVNFSLNLSPSWYAETIVYIYYH